MKRRLTILLSAVWLLCACQTGKPSSASTVLEDEGDSASVYAEMAYQELFADSLAKAEVHAYRAVMLSNDSTLECGALSLLCYIYYREGKQQELQLLMQTLRPEAYMNVMDVQMHVEQTRAGRERQLFALAIVLLLLISGMVCYWYIRRMRSLTARYRQRIDSVRHELLTRQSSLTDRDDSQPASAALPIDETKQGIDVLFAIINDQNISQMGKQEEQAVLKTIPVVDAALAATLRKATSPLTPKETFFCIMEYYGKDDHQKARSFCCSEQAVRSTKSRLNKKIDIASLRSEP